MDWKKTFTLNRQNVKGVQMLEIGLAIPTDTKFQPLQLALTKEQWSAIEEAFIVMSSGEIGKAEIVYD